MPSKTNLQFRRRGADRRFKVLMFLTEADPLTGDAFKFTYIYGYDVEKAYQKQAPFPLWIHRPVVFEKGVCEHCGQRLGSDNPGWTVTDKVTGASLLTIREDIPRSEVFHKALALWNDSDCYRRCRNVLPRSALRRSVRQTKQDRSSLYQTSSTR